MTDSSLWQFKDKIYNKLNRLEIKISDEDLLRLVEFTDSLNNIFDNVVLDALLDNFMFNKDANLVEACLLLIEFGQKIRENYESGIVLYLKNNESNLYKELQEELNLFSFTLLGDEIQHLYRRFNIDEYKQFSLLIEFHYVYLKYLKYKYNEQKAKETAIKAWQMYCDVLFEGLITQDELSILLQNKGVFDLKYEHIYSYILKKIDKIFIR